jgi:hypothetical protein
MGLSRRDVLFFFAGSLPPSLTRPAALAARKVVPNCGSYHHQRFSPFLEISSNSLALCPTTSGLGPLDFETS